MADTVSQTVLFPDLFDKPLVATFDPPHPQKVFHATTPRPVAACAAIAGRFVPVARARAAAHRRAVPGPATPGPRAGAGGRAPLTRCCVGRGGGVMRCAGWPGASARGAPAPAAPDRRRVGPRRRAVPAHE